MARIAFNFRFSPPGDMFCNIDRVDKIRTPTLIVHGCKDDVVGIFFYLVVFGILFDFVLSSFVVVVCLLVIVVLLFVCCLL